MRIVTWNCNSLNARGALVSDFLAAESPDVLVLQELKLETERVPVARFTDLGYHVAVHGQRAWNGVLIASRTPLSDVMTGLPAAEQGQSRVLAATTAGVRFVNVYAPQGQSVDSEKFAYKLDFYDALIAWLEEEMRAAPGSTAPALVLLGDLNIAPGPGDLWDPEGWAEVPSHHPLERQRFARLTALGLADLVAPRVPPGTFTFWDYRGAAFRMNQGLRIDHILGTAPVAQRVLSAEVGRGWRKKRGELTPSDHAPVTVTLGP
jgi:exodeoxyribonuclease-3